MLFNDLQSLKEHSPIDVIEEGIDIAFNAVQDWKVYGSIDFILAGVPNPILFNEEHLEKALDSMVDIDAWINICFKEEQLEKALDPIKVTELGILISLSNLHPENVNFWIEFKEQGLQNKTVFKDLQSQKIEEPILTTDEGIDIFESDSHPAKAEFPISFKDDGDINNICSNFEQ